MDISSETGYVRLHPEPSQTATQDRKRSSDSKTEPPLATPVVPAVPPGPVVPRPDRSEPCVILIAVFACASVVIWTICSVEIWRLGLTQFSVVGINSCECLGAIVFLDVYLSVMDLLIYDVKNCLKGIAATCRCAWFVFSTLALWQMCVTCHEWVVVNRSSPAVVVWLWLLHVAHLIYGALFTLSFIVYGLIRLRSGQ